MAYETCEIIEKYYKYLEFPKKYDRAFYDALKEVKISDTVSINTYDYEDKDGRRNLLSYLFMCEALKNKYEDKEIPEKIMKATLKDMVLWTEIWSDLKESLYLGEIEWLSNHLKMKLFRIGRLHFRMGSAEHDVPEKNLRQGDNVIEIHIPAGETLETEKCRESIKLAKEFFANYFPEFEYRHFTCDSWLMDDTLKGLLPEKSNIVRFMNLFDRFHKEKSDAILRYVFKWDTTRQNLENAVQTSSLAVKVKEHIKNGKDFYTAYGVIDRE